MDYFNRMNDLEGRNFEFILQWYLDSESSKDALCYQYHSWSLAVARRFYSSRSYVTCIRFCQQRLGHSPKHLFSPRLTPAYWTSRAMICSSVRDCPVPDYFKVFYMIYHLYSHYKLKHYAIASSEAAHTVILLYSIIKRVERDDDYIVDFTEMKRAAILFRLLHHLRNLTEFLRCCILKWDKQHDFSIGKLTRSELSIGAAVTFDYIYEAAQAMYHAVTNGVCRADLVDDYVHAIFSTIVTANVVLPGNSPNSGYHLDMTFPICCNATGMPESMQTDVVVRFWKARLLLICATAYIHERRYECAIFKLGAAQDDLETVWRKLEEDPQSDNVQNNGAPRQAELSVHKSGTTRSLVSHGVFEELDLILTTADLRRRDVLGDTVDKEYVHSLLVKTQCIMRTCQLQFRQRVAHKRKLQKGDGGQVRPGRWR
ncbi:hypothetical protein V1517DRAFT_46271 [Lipomyces orientalis]|uniref:Uncharacterized protein n=1 Tax=Lipomyces orientalis TaxID=1233043 RepID=A0ACC3TE97_9ASCO